jgi:catechol 2,3-dioxygenase-like lactoylglutathione lyase family enzyme
MAQTSTGPDPEAGNSQGSTWTDPDRRVGAGIDTSIYGMPAFVTFTVADLQRSMRWYTEGLGFIVLAELRGPDGSAALVHLRRHRYQDILLLPALAAGPGGLGGQLGGQLGVRGVRYTISAGAEDLTARAEQAAACAVEGGTVDGPARTAWNTVDLVCTDPDGHEVVLTATVAADQKDQQFSATVLDSVRV